MNAASKLRVFNDMLTLGLVLAKVAADFQRHGTHKRHSQQCLCLSQCVKCTIEALRDRAVLAQAAKVAQMMAERGPRPAG